MSLYNYYFYINFHYIYLFFFFLNVDIREQTKHFISIDINWIGGPRNNRQDAVAWIELCMNDSNWNLLCWPFGVKYLHAADSSKTALLQKPEVFVGLIMFILPLALDGKSLSSGIFIPFKQHCNEHKPIIVSLP